MNNLTWFVIGSIATSLLFLAIREWRKQLWRKTFVELKWGDSFHQFRMDILRYAGDLYHQGHGDQTVGCKIGDKFPEFYNEKFMYSIAYKHNRCTMRSDNWHNADKSGISLD